ncbi:MAG TPA: CAP domain-containing protein [Candidatus Paceibacterota bacterium]|nr:CAP domain-containing protein [Candidatus Paceibacterota bacterium]
MDFLRKLKDHFIPSKRNVYRPHMLRRPWLLFFLTVVLTSEAVFVADLIARQSAFNFVAAVLPGEVIALTNDERATNNVGQLTENADLDAAAQAKAEDMAAKGYFAHVGPDGKEPWTWISEYGYSYQAAGENLAVRFEDSSDVVNAWMASPTHRANIVKPVYTQIGVGVAQGIYQGAPATYVVQYFGEPKQAGSSVSTAAGGVQQVAASEAAPAGAQVAGAETEAAPSTDAQPAAADTSEAQAEPTTAAPSAPVETSAAAPVSPHSSTPWSSFARELVRGDTQPSSSIEWVLAGVAVVLMVGLALAFFIHIQIQPTDMLIGGAVVAMIAIALIFLNAQTPFAGKTNLNQSASVFGAYPASGGFISTSAASVGQ